MPDTAARERRCSCGDSRGTALVTFSGAGRAPTGSRSRSNLGHESAAVPQRCAVGGTPNLTRSGDNSMCPLPARLHAPYDVPATRSGTATRPTCSAAHVDLTGDRLSWTLRLRCGDDVLSTMAPVSGT